MRPSWGRPDWKYWACCRTVVIAMHRMQKAPAVTEQGSLEEHLRGSGEEQPRIREGGFRPRQSSESADDATTCSFKVDMAIHHKTHLQLRLNPATLAVSHFGSHSFSGKHFAKKCVAGRPEGGTEAPGPISGPPAPHDPRRSRNPACHC